MYLKGLPSLLSWLRHISTTFVVHWLTRLCWYVLPPIAASTDWEQNTLQQNIRLVGRDEWWIGWLRRKCNVKDKRHVILGTQHRTYLFNDCAHFIHNKGCLTKQTNKQCITFWSQSTKSVTFTLGLYESTNTPQLSRGRNSITLTVDIRYDIWPSWKNKCQRESHQKLKSSIISYRYVPQPDIVSMYHYAFALQYQLNHSIA